MNLTEVLSEKNNNVRFRCVDNNFIVRNDNGLLLHLNKTFEDGTQNWNKCVVSNIWINSEYKRIK